MHAAGPEHAPTGPPTPAPVLPPLSNKLAARLADPTSRIVVLTGAGISAAANIRTYRGTGGLYPTGTLIPLTASDARSRTIHDLWRRLADITTVTAAAAPTAAHRALAGAEAAGRPITVITQNVDGLHGRAGSTVIELHGNLTTSRCLNPGCAAVHPLPTNLTPATAAEVDRCPHDGARLRPNVVLFGEMLDRNHMRAASLAAHAADVVLAVGTSLQVHPATGYVINALGSGAAGAWLELDPDTMRGDLDPVDRAALAGLEPIPGDCQVTLPAVLNLAEPSAH